MEKLCKNLSESCSAWLSHYTTSTPAQHLSLAVDLVGNSPASVSSVVGSAYFLNDFPSAGGIVK